MIDWSGEATARPEGLAVAHLSIDSTRPTLVQPEDGWSRQALLGELLRQADAGADLLIGLDLSPGLPFVDCGAYFPGWAASPGEAKELWRLVDRLSVADPHLTVAGFLNHPVVGEYFLHQSRKGGSYAGGGGRLRKCEQAQAAMQLTPYSCFRLIGAAQVGKSSLTGMRVLNQLKGRIPVWPFDPVPASGPMIVEIYTSLAAREAGVVKGRSKIRTKDALDAALAIQGCRAPATLSRYDDDHATDALLTVAWLKRAAARSELWVARDREPDACRTEGWTFGVP